MSGQRRLDGLDDGVHAAQRGSPLVFLGIGANLPTLRYGLPLAGCEAALALMPAYGVRVERRSRWYRSAPVPPSDQPDFVNGVVQVVSRLAPAALIAALHDIEREFGRRRAQRDAARTLDLDLLVYGDTVSSARAHPTIPHPRMHERAFVLAPLAEIAPDWRHPRFGVGAAALLDRLPLGQVVEPIETALG